MSSKLTKALEFANYRTTLNIQHNNLKAKVQTLLNYSINGGTFEISQTLISFVKVLIDQEHDKAVLLDIYNNPIEVELKVVNIDGWRDKRNKNRNNNKNNTAFY